MFCPPDGLAYCDEESRQTNAHWTVILGKIIRTRIWDASPTSHNLSLADMSGSSDN
jgi:hypothetical protein